MFKKRILYLLVLSMCCIVISSCGTDDDNITPDDVYGSWLCSATDKYRDISFYPDGSYTTTDFLPSGAFEVEDGNELLLISSYGTATRIIANRCADGTWELEYSGDYAKLSFSREMQSANTETEKEAIDFERAEIFGSAVSQLLCSGVWTLDTGDLAFTPTAFTFHGDIVLAYQITYSNGFEGLYEFELATDVGEICGSISEVRNEVDDIQGYELTISYSNETATCYKEGAVIFIG